MESDDPLAKLDMYMGLVAGLIFVTQAWTYYLMPPFMPTEEMANGKPSFFSWFTGVGCLPYVRKFQDRPMTFRDFPDSVGTERHNIELFHDRITAMWSPKSESSLHMFCIRWALPWWCFCHILLGAERSLDLLEPYIITCIIRYLEQSNTEVVWAVPLKIALLKLLIRVAKSTAHIQCEAVLAIRAFDQIWAGLELVVLRKLHRTSMEGLHLGQISSTYTQQIISDCREQAAVLWGTPLRSVCADTIVGFYALYELGMLYGRYIFLIGFATSTGLFYLSALCIRKQFETGSVGWIANLTRQSTLNMMFERFRELRMYNWTTRCAKVLEESRTNILAQHLRGMKWGVLSGTFNTVINPWISIVAFFITAFVNGERVNFQKGLLAYNYMTVVTMSLMLLTACRGTYLDIFYRSQRIEGFLKMPECGEEPPRASESSSLVLGRSASVEVGADLCVTGATYVIRVGKDAGEFDFPLLSEVHLHPRRGELVIVTGATGAGKTTLLNALMGEYRLSAGSATLPEGPIAFQPQVPYLLDGTIKDNVLFGVPANECCEEHLWRALEASQLAAEMRNPRSTLSAKREHTRVGKRGSQLSGGQRARVNLARTVYAALQGTNLVLLDDPVASVDNEVLHAAWEAVVLKELASTTRIVAANTQLLERLAPTADRLVVVKGGRLVFNGTLAEAESHKELITLALGGEFDLSRGAAAGSPSAAGEGTSAATASAPQAAEDTPGQPEPEDGGGGPEDSALALADFARESQGLRSFLRSSERGRPPQMRPAEWRALQAKLQALEQGHKPEPPHPARPQPLWRLALQFFFRTWGLPVVTVILNFAKNFSTPIQYTTVTMWENQVGGWGDKLYFLAIATQVTMFSFVDVALGNLDNIGNMLSSMSLRRDMDNKVMALGMPYFWGVRGIEEQFRKLVYADLDSLTMLFRNPMAIVQIFLGAAVPASHSPILWLVILVSILPYWQVTKLSEWQQVKLMPARNDALANLDLQVQDQFDSLATLRALKRTGAFDKLLQPAMTLQMYWNYMHRSCELLIHMLNNLIGSVFLLYAGYLLARLKLSGVDPAMALGAWQVTDGVGGMIAAAVNMYLPFQNCVARYRELEAFLETPYVDPQGGNEPPKGWPSEGRICFENVTFRYSAYMPTAVSDVSFEVRAREKLGVVGKTGSGKSTCASLLLRLGPLKGVPPSSGGRVLVDGVDLASLRVDVLRRMVAVVPQEPTVFPWNLKSNIGEEFTDAEVLSVLDACGLDARQLTGHDDLLGSLYRGVAPGITVGQQQLLMAARALIRRPKVMILDECTAALDREAADRLLDVVTRHTKDATVISIAHRLRFVLKSDRILVLGHNGAILGCGTPEQLLEDSAGYFATNLRLEQSEESEALVAKAAAA